MIKTVIEYLPLNPVEVSLPRHFTYFTKEHNDMPKIKTNLRWCHSSAQADGTF